MPPGRQAAAHHVARRRDCGAQPGLWGGQQHWVPLAAGRPRRRAVLCSFRLGVCSGAEARLRLGFAQVSSWAMGRDRRRPAIHRSTDHLGTAVDDSPIHLLFVCVHDCPTTHKRACVGKPTRTHTQMHTPHSPPPCPMHSTAANVTAGVRRSFRPMHAARLTPPTSSRRLVARDSVLRLVLASKAASTAGVRAGAGRPLHPGVGPWVAQRPCARQAVNGNGRKGLPGAQSRVL